MVDLNELENYLNANSCSDGDIVEILNEGVIEAKQDAKSGRKYKVLNLSVRCGTLELIFSPNTDALAIMKEKWGNNTKNFIGKKFQVKIYPKTSFGVTKDAILPVILEQKA